MSYKKFLTAFFGLTVSLVVLISAIFYYIDPLFLYRKTELYRAQYPNAERYQMPGLVKMQKYDTLFTGTSMGRNFVENYADEKFGSQSFNASLPGSTAKEQSMVAELALREHNPKHILWELNYYSFASKDPDWVMGHPSDFPGYMYDKSKVNDIRYLFNSYNIKALYRNLSANKRGDESWRDVEKLYKFGENAPKETTERITNFLNNAGPMAQLPDYETSETMMNSFQENVMRLAKSHPDTKFTLFFAPYPIYNHVSFYKRHHDYLKERLKFKEEVYTLISKYPNIELYDFQDEAAVTFNIANYMGDGVHYQPYINKWIIDQIAEKPPINGLDVYKQKLKLFEMQIENFDMNQLTENDSIKKNYVTEK
ncbi:MULTISPECIES: hypothetical protein [unclassified Bacillus (in: firmicutes)]|uniref:hypothetical protein n=1 Tax=unclassified Bacillus (in: firmicutes) TaxID=185979 RepID=UPI0008E32681|nr:MULTISPECIES: hypothetical protein [unclassified Bacillus (in: firmicutes)]SFB25427.1 hypothetical protein SAMN02799634_11425 [Bacillus sp. UNCCL13]SFQ91745.1 hypothetical protein SAMN04488577_0158 [Bacillus sp. cl95]